MSVPNSFSSTFIDKPTQIELSKDPKFVKFTYVVERTLSAFESVSEWADVSAFLSRLLKCFETYPQFKVIPHKLTLGKRLAQCLNPALPTGVHQKALAVYACIFQKMGGELLGQDLAIYAYGLFPFMQYASMSIKPQLLDLYELHILGLGHSLRPCCKSLVIGLLPGLDEEGNEFFEKVLKLMDVLCLQVGQAHFFQAIWLALITYPKTRIAAIHFLVRRFPESSSCEDMAFALGDHSGLLVQAVAASLSDKEMLVKRGMLDILVKFLPLHAKIITPEYSSQLAGAVLSIFLYRDMSLNRRVYTWLLGGGEIPETNTNYFVDNSREIVFQALESLFRSQQMDLSELQVPYRILISLMDKEELGPAILQIYFPVILEAIYCQITKHPNFKVEILANLKLFLETVDPFFVWSHFNKMLVSSDLYKAEGKANLDMLKLLIKASTSNDEEVDFIHLPCLLINLLNSIEDRAVSEDFGYFENELIVMLEIASNALSKLPKDVFNPELDEDDLVEDLDGLDIKSPTLKGLSKDLGLLINAYYQPSDEDQKGSQANALHKLSVNIKGQQLFLALFYKVLNIISAINNGFILNRPKVSLRSTQLFTASTELLKQLTSFPIHNNSSQLIMLRAENSSKFLEEWTAALVDSCCHCSDFRVVNLTVTCLVDLTIKELLPTELFITSSILVAILDQLWPFLSSSHEGHHCRAVELIWQLSAVFPLVEIETYLCSQVSEIDSANGHRELDRFGWFWKVSSENGHSPSKCFSKPLLILIDALADESAEIRQASQAWVRAFITNYSDLLNVMLEFLLNSEFRRSLTPKPIYANPPYQYDGDATILDLVEAPGWAAVYETMPDLLQANYILSTLLSLTRSEGRAFIDILLHTTILDGSLPLNVEMMTGEPNYFCLFTQVMLGFLVTDVSPSLGREKRDQNINLFCTIGQLLYQWVSYLDSTPDLKGYQSMIGQVLKVVHLRLGHWIKDQSTSPQIEFLPLIMAILNLSELDLTVSGFDELRSEVEFSIVHRMYPIPPHHPSSASWPTSLPVPSLYLSFLLRLCITEPCAHRTLQHWYEAFLLVMPHLYTPDAMLLVVEPVLDCAQSHMRSFPFQINVGTTTIEFVNQAYSTLAVGLGIKKWAHLSSSAPKSHSVFDRLSSVMLRPNPSSEIDRELIQVLANRLPTLLQALADAWISLVANRHSASPHMDSNEPSNVVANRAQSEIVRSVESLASLFHKDFFTAFVEAWYMVNNPHAGSEVNEQDELLRILIKTPSFSTPSYLHEWMQLARRKMLESASTNRTTKRRNSNHIYVTDLALLRFMDRFLRQVPIQCDGSLASMWSILLTFFRDALYNINNQKYLLYPLLSNRELKMGHVYRLFDQFCKHGGYAEGINDRKLKKEAQDLFQRVMDQLVVATCKSLDQSSWLKLNSSSSTDNVMYPTASPVAEPSSIPAELTHLYHVTSFISTSILPHLPSHLPDPSLLVSTLLNLVYYFIGPSLKSPTACYPIALSMLAKMASWESVYKVWKREGWEGFMDPKFFDGEVLVGWCEVVEWIVRYEPDKIYEVIGKISVTASNLFSSRDAEILTSSLMLRRLGIMIYSLPLDHHLVALPSIQEKLVELIKSNPPPTIQTELFLCLRVLLLRFSGSYLTSFWPVLLTELIQIFQTRPNLKGSEVESRSKAGVMLAVCKFVDLAIALQVEEFQMYQWVFINETLDFVSGDQQAISSLLDRLGRHPSTKLLESPSVTRQPLLTSISSIDTIDDLQPFFNTISAQTFQGSYLSLKLDLKTIEKAMLIDLVRSNQPHINDIEDEVNE